MFVQYFGDHSDGTLGIVHGKYTIVGRGYRELAYPGEMKIWRTGSCPEESKYNFTAVGYGGDVNSGGPIVNGSAGNVLNGPSEFTYEVPSVEVQGDWVDWQNDLGLSEEVLGIAIWGEKAGPDGEWQSVLMQNPWCDE